MALFGDTVSRVLTEYKADISDHKAKVKELTGEEQALAKAELEAAEARNQQFESWIGGLAKVGVSLMAVKELGDVVWEGYKESIHEARLETAAAGVDLDKLSTAAGGLHTHLQLLEFAARANQGAFRLSQEQMELAEKAMHALEQRGVPTQEAIDAVTSAVVTGRTRGLEPYGVVVDKHMKDLQALGEENMTLMQKYELHTRVLQALKPVADSVSDSQNAIGESMEQTQVRLANSWAELKKGLGQLAVAFQPVLEALAKTLDLLSDVAKVQRNKDSDHPYLRAFILGGDTVALEDKVADMQDQLKQSIGPGVGGLVGGLDQGLHEEILKAEQLYADITQRASGGKATKLSPGQKKEVDEAVARAFLHGNVTIDGTREVRTGDLYNPKDAQRLGLAGRQINEQALADTTYRDQEGVAIDYFAKFQQDQEAAAKLAAQKQSATQEKFLEKTFGKLTDFDAYHEAFKSLSGAISSAFDAWVTGSESVGTAFKRFIGDALKSLASQMFVESLKHAAYAIGSVAFGDFAGAAKHAEAAAAFAAGAVVAGAAAKELGGGAAPRSSAGGGGASTGTGGAPRGTSPHSGQQNGGPIIVVGDAFADDSPRMRQVKAARLVGQALGTSAGSYH